MTRAPLLLILLAGGCPASDPLERLVAPLSTTKVAAIQYASGQATAVKSCSGAAHADTCAVQDYVSQAKLQGAVLVVAPENVLDQSYYEPDPKVGDNPGTDPTWPSNAPNLKAFSQQAKQLGLTVVVHLLTKAAGVPKPYSTQVALGPDGRVLATHHKFELFGGEKTSYTAGTDVAVFDHPQLGKVGLLICADIYGDLNLHRKLTETLGARVIAFSSAWTAAGAANFQQSYARNWGVWFVGSNVSGGTGKGGGIYDPQGAILARVEQSVPSLQVASIPTP